MSTITVKIKFAWWLKLYLFGLITTCKLMGTFPDIDKVSAVIRKAARIELV